MQQHTLYAKFEFEYEKKSVCKFLMKNKKGKVFKTEKTFCARYKSIIHNAFFTQLVTIEKKGEREKSFVLGTKNKSSWKSFIS